MPNAPLTPAETRYLKDLQRLASSTRSRVLGWMLELVPGIAQKAVVLPPDADDAGVSVPPG